MALKDTLDSLKTPQERDIYLSRIWKGFAKGEAHEALVMALGEILAIANRTLLAPGTDATTRAHSAGIVSCVFNLHNVINSAINFDPAAADYSDPNPDLVPEGADDLPPDDTQLI